MFVIGLDKLNWHFCVLGNCAIVSTLYISFIKETTFGPERVKDNLKEKASRRKPLLLKQKVPLLNLLLYLGIEPEWFKKIVGKRMKTTPEEIKDKLKSLKIYFSDYN